MRWYTIHGVYVYFYSAQVDGIEAHLDPWTAALWPALKTLSTTGARANGATNGAAKPTEAAKPAAPPLRRLTVLHSGDLASDISELVVEAAKGACPKVEARVMAMDEFKPWLKQVQAGMEGAPEHAVFVCQVSRPQLYIYFTYAYTHILDAKRDRD